MDRRIMRRSVLKAGAGSSFVVLMLANGNKIVAQTSSPEAITYTEAPALAELVAAGISRRSTSDFQRILWKSNLWNVSAPTAETFVPHFWAEPTPACLVE